MNENNPLVGNIIIADDHPFYSNGLEKAIMDIGLAKQVFKVANGNQVLETARNNPIDLIFMDCNMPLMDGITCTQKVKELFPAIKIITLSGTCTHEKITAALNAGSDGYLTKEMNEEKLNWAITSVLNNEKPFCKEAVLILSNKIINLDTSKTTVELSDREKEVGFLLTKGLTIQKVGNKLNMSYSTARTHKERMFGKTGTNNLKSLVVFLVESKIFENYNLLLD